MRQMIKRLGALMLALCTLASFVIVPTWADNEESVVATYDIWLYDGTLGADEGYNALFPQTNTRHVNLVDLKDELDGLYNDNEINWTFIASGNTANLVYRSSSMLLRLRGGANNWAALKIKVPESGNFALTYGVDTTVAANNGSITAWVFPASGEESAATIPALMTEANCVGTQNMAGSSKITFNAKDYVAGEYIVVYQGSINDIWLGELGLVRTKEGVNETDPTDPSASDETTLPDTVGCGGTYTEGTYNFALYTDHSRAPMFTTGDGLADVK